MVYMSNIRTMQFYQYISGLLNKIILQRYDVLIISFVKNIDTEFHLKVFIGRWNSS